MGAPTGIMDQTASMLASTDAAVLIDCLSLETKIVELGLEAQNFVVAVIDTQVSHRHSDGGYRSRRDSCEKGALIMGVSSLRELGQADLDSCKIKARRSHLSPRSPHRHRERPSASKRLRPLKPAK